MSMLKNNIYTYEDDYMFFAFNGIHSSEYNLIIQNDIEDLKIILATGGKVDFISTPHQIGQHFTGVSHPSKKVSLKLIAQNVTREKAIEIGHWLRVGEQGALIFDFAQDWCYDIVISSSKDMNLYEQGNNSFIVSFEVEFTTTTSPYARLVNQATAFYMGEGADSIQNSAFNNSLGIPVIYLEEPIPSEGAENSRIQREVDLICLGDHNIFFTATNTFKPGEGSVKFSISADLGYDAFNTSIEADISESGNTDTCHVIAFNSESNNYLADDTLPQQAQLYGHYDELDVKYNYKRLELFSPGTPKALKDYLKEELPTLFASPFYWLLCKPAQYFTYEYAEMGITIDSQNTSPNYMPWVLSNPIIKKKLNTESIISFIDSLGQDWSDYYFCYYLPLTVSWEQYKDNTDRPMGEIKVIQYKEAL